jgi:DNA repair protein RadC
MTLDPEDDGDEALVARLLGARTRDAAAVRSAARLLVAAGGIAALAQMDEREIAEMLSAMKVRRARAAAHALAVAFELGRRARIAEAIEPVRFADTRDVVAWAQPRLGSLVHEELWVLALDGRGGLRAARCVAKGGLHGVAVRATDPLRIAIRAGATAFALVHNHPSGDPSPSAEDVSFTRRLADAARIVGLPLLDHVVVTRHDFASVPVVEGVAA